MELKAGFVCERGLNPKRPVNQDRFLALPERGLFAVFDGVGGQRAGEVASQTAADTVEEALTIAEALSHIQDGSSADLICRAIGFANRDIFEMAESNPSYKTMATTVALVHINNDHATIAHVGDSRVYRLEEGRLSRETIDHTDLDDDLRAGRITREKAARQQNRNVINRALGVEPEVEVEVKTIHVHEGARLLLCSDGIYRHLADDEIARLLAEHEDPQRAADELKRVVYERGAEDNLAAVVVQVGRARQVATAGSGGRMHTSQKSLEASAAAPSPAARTGIPNRSGRIQVELSSETRSQESMAYKRTGAEPPERQERSSALRKLIYVLMALVLAAGSFYGGLRASEFVKRPPSEPNAANGESDPLRAGREAFERGDYQAAIAQFDSILQSKPDHAEAHYWMGRAQLEGREYQKAAQSFEQAINLKPAMKDAYLQAAAAYEAAGEKNKAAQMLSRYGEERRKAQR
ncbi:MAG: protein phosphatase 2C domain-containing protein [Blastocatellia bacterium]|nr:protein phosphatase 2C domain-containing protein [Blastocatellia bacterium]